MTTFDQKTVRLPWLTYVLGAGTFLMGTTEFVIAGLLPELAHDLGVSVAHAGLLITAFALGMIVGPPTMAVATRRLPHRRTLVLALLAFAATHVVVALGSSFTVLLVARFLSALATGAFWAVAAVVATRAVGPAAGSRALGVVLGGGMLANVVGVPLGALRRAVGGLAWPVLGLSRARDAGRAAGAARCSARRPGSSGLVGRIGVRGGRLGPVVAGVGGMCDHHGERSGDLQLHLAVAHRTSRDRGRVRAAGTGRVRGGCAGR
ncbi:MFS transporter [Amycolatopsis acidicola]|uniref:MFS transporter n=1 Tax=Amycolatopsis acidicola TaxID=2596893 RepID=UPI001FB688D4|nr:MFS transporter [Amycolatopsis acidicola]